ncbi:MAG: hypothetical protein JNL83_31015 [Myxococcales bacterium]|nr:hypothetical protein [Myxococcales bacterium]
MQFGWLAAMLVVGCGESPMTAHDADVVPDIVADVAAPDAPSDAPPDTAPDAPLPSLSPTCATAPAVLIDVAPHRVGNIARAGDMLYVGSYLLDISGMVTDARITPIDLTTRQSGATLSTVGSPWLQPANGTVYGVDNAAGTIWRFAPNTAPVALVTGRSQPRAATADTTHVYWAEGSGTVYRRLLAGGTVETITTCSDARYLIIDGNDLYCAPIAPSVYRAPKAGGSAVSIGNVTYPIGSMLKDGTDLYVTNLSPNAELYRIPIPGGPAALVKQISGPTRFGGLAATADFFYVTDSGAGIRRVDRVTTATDVIYASPSTLQDPVIWNNQLYFAKQDSLVLHCVN